MSKFLKQIFHVIVIGKGATYRSDPIPQLYQYVSDVPVPEGMDSNQAQTLALGTLSYEDTQKLNWRYFQAKPQINGLYKIQDVMLSPDPSGVNEYKQEVVKGPMDTDLTLRQAILKLREYEQQEKEFIEYVPEGLKKLRKPSTSGHHHSWFIEGNSTDSAKPKNEPQPRL